MSDDIYRNYLHDLGILIKEIAIEAKTEKDRSVGKAGEDFATGYMAGFHRVVSLMKQQADAFDISQSEIAMEDIDADKDLV